ncbi:MAG: hypothetical protein WC124_07290 [Desulfoplanes sp.]
MNKEQAKNLRTKIESIQSLMIAFVTDVREDSQPREYVDLYADLYIDLEDTGYENPNQHKTLEIFWSYCKLKNMGTWADRRAYVQELYADIILDLTRAIKKGKDPRNWGKTNEALTDELAPVRIQWLKAKNFIYTSPPDFENSIKESINSIESTLKILLQEPKGTLGKLLNKTEIDKDIKSIISQAYGMVSNKDFVRHGGIESQNLNASEAEFFIEFSGIAIAYLKSKLGAKKA